MTPQERNARAYCHSIGADPDETVMAWRGTGIGRGSCAYLPRWQLYIGAVIQHRHAAE